MVKLAIITVGKAKSRLRTTKIKQVKDFIDIVRRKEETIAHISRALRKL